MKYCKGEPIHLAVAFDEKYIVPFYALLSSIFENNRGNIVVIHSIVTGVEDSEQARIARYVESNKAQIHFYSVGSSPVKGLVVPSQFHYTQAAYYRLLFPALVPREVRRLLYIDTDAVVVGDLSELYQLDIGSFPVAAAIDTGTLNRPELGIVEAGHYFNSGVLLIDTGEWRRQQVSEKAVEFALKHPEKIVFVDQDALNAVLQGNWHKLERRFNLMYGNISNFSTRRKIKEQLREVVVVHYTTEHKPWFGLCTNRLRYLYHDYLRLSPKSEHYKKYVDFKISYGYLRKFVLIRLKEIYFNLPALGQIKNLFISKD